MAFLVGGPAGSYQSSEAATPASATPPGPRGAGAEGRPRAPDRQSLGTYVNRNPAKGDCALCDGINYFSTVMGAEINSPAPAYEGAAAEHAAGTIALVVADSPIPGGKAA